MTASASAAGQELAEALQRAAAVPRLLVCADFDGTVSPIVDDPADARALPAAVDALETLAGLADTTVALVSGRALADLAGRSGLGPPVRLVGSHGIELDDSVSALPLGGAQLLARLRSELQEIADDVPGVILETKSASVALHVRQAERADAARLTAAALAGPGALDGVHVLQGKEVVELSVVEPDKGAALERLRAQTSADAVVYLGDDTTDEDAFSRLVAPDVGIKVGSGTTLAAFRVDDPHDVSDLLAHLAALRAWSLDSSDSGATLPVWPSPISRPLT
jgi:trehalose 6-phosphate phosphatase